VIANTDSHLAIFVCLHYLRKLLLYARGTMRSTGGCGWLWKTRRL